MLWGLCLVIDAFSEEAALTWRILNFVFGTIIRTVGLVNTILTHYKCWPCADPITFSPAFAIACDQVRKVAQVVVSVILKVLGVVSSRLFSLSYILELLINVFSMNPPGTVNQHCCVQ